MARPRPALSPASEIEALLDQQNRLALRVTPGARQEGIAIDAGRVLVKVRAKPEDGAANDAVIRLVAGALDIAPSRIALLRGATSREKLIVIER